MAQLFGPATNTIARASLLCSIALPFVVLLAASQITRSPYNTKVNIAVDQPVFFSHNHHAYELGIDCRFCHTSVEKSAYAGVPPTQTCMTCHSQIWTNSPLLEPVRQSFATGTPLKWNLLNKVPDYVYFNHSIHVQKGISCNICHGPVQNMNMTYKAQPFHMAWCLQCHRNPENYIRPKEEVFNLYAKYQTNAPVIPDQKIVSDKGITREEVALLRGNAPNRSAAMIEEGRKLVEKYNIKVKQLDDCWICHR